MPGIFPRKGIGDHPEAELLALQSSFAVGDQRFEEIRSCLIKKTKVRPPGHVTDDVDSRLPHLGGHRGYLPKFVLAKRVPQPAFQTETSYRRSLNPTRVESVGVLAGRCVRYPPPHTTPLLLLNSVYRTDQLPDR